MGLALDITLMMGSILREVDVVSCLMNWRDWLEERKDVFFVVAVKIR